jgi:hypothetical protein
MSAPHPPPRRKPSGEEGKNQTPNSKALSKNKLRNEQSAFDRRSERKEKNEEALNTLFEEKRKRKRQTQTLILLYHLAIAFPTIHDIGRHSLTLTQGCSSLFVGRRVAPTSVGVKMRLVYL